MSVLEILIAVWIANLTLAVTLVAVKQYQLEKKASLNILKGDKLYEVK